MLNRMNTGVLGDSGDTRVVELTGIANLDSITTVEVDIWAPGVDKTATACTVAVSADRTINAPVGTFLAGAKAKEGTWSLEIVLDRGLATELTFPAERPAAFPVRS